MVQVRKYKARLGNCGRKACRFIPAFLMSLDLKLWHYARRMILGLAPVPAWRIGLQQQPGHQWYLPWEC